MNSFAIASLLVFAASLANAAFVFFSHPRNLLKVLWGLISLIVAMVGINLFWMMTAGTYQTAYLHSLILNTAIVLIPVLYFHFTLVLTGKTDRRATELTLYYLLTIIYLALTAVFPKNFIPSVGPVLEIKYYCRSGPLFYFLPFWFAYLVGYGMALVCQNYSKATAIKRNQLKYFIMASAIGMIGGISAFLPAMSVPVRPWGIYLLPVYLLMVAYAIMKHRLMDIEIVLRKSLVYSCVVSLLTVFFFIFVFLSENIFKNMVGYTSFQGSLLAIALITILAIPLYRLVQSLIDRLFFKGNVVQIAQENSRLQEEMLLLETNRTIREVACALVEEIQEPLQRIREQSPPALEIDVCYLEEIIGQLREYSRIVPEHYVELNLTALLDEVLGGVSSQTDLTKGKLFKYYQSEETIKVQGSATQLKQAFSYIIDHCWVAVQKDGEIFVSLDHNKTWLSLNIRHSGYGLSEQEAEQIFQPFFKTKHFKGNLHLATAKAIITQHGGKAKAESQEGVSTAVEFLIELPII